MRIPRASVLVVFLGLLVLIAAPAVASVELCSELMIESYELEEFQPFLDQWEAVGEDQGGLKTLGDATERIATTSELISKDVFANKYERELARSVSTAADDMETALDKQDAAHLYPAYEVLMETIDYLTGACFTTSDATPEEGAKADPEATEKEEKSPR